MKALSRPGDDLQRLNGIGERQVRFSAGDAFLQAALCVMMGSASLLFGQAAISAGHDGGLEKKSELKFVVIVSRHGVRSPTGRSDQLNLYSRQPWPAWSVPPGYLTQHGAKLMTLFGQYDRELFAAEGLLGADGCADAHAIHIIADSDQRTRETGKALAAGLAPGCNVPVTARPEGTPDPFFHPLEAAVGKPDKLVAAAAIEGRIGANPKQLVEAYRPQLQELEAVLAGNGADPDCEKSKPQGMQSLFDVPTSIAPGKGDHLVELSTPLSFASTIAEDLLLEYAEGMEACNVGWGHVDRSTLNEFMQLHEAHEDLAQRTTYVARAQSSNLLQYVFESMEQAAGVRTVTKSLTVADDKLLILVGHDTNIANIAGALGLSWIIDGRRDDTPPGGALEFELWKGDAGEYSVRLFYTAQTLDQMRNATLLSLKNPPERVPVFIPGCSRSDFSCDWKSFQRAMTSAIDPRFVDSGETRNPLPLKPK
jgi:4-phytase / acid phosphatase